MITRAFQRLQRALGVGKERFFVGNDLAGNRYLTRVCLSLCSFPAVWLADGRLELFFLL